MKILQRPRTLVAGLNGVQEKKNTKKNQNRKQRKKLLKGLKRITSTNHGDDLPTASNSEATKRLRESCSTQSTPISNRKQKRSRIESEHAELEGTKREEKARTSITAWYAGAVLTSNQKLVATRKGSNGDTPIIETDLQVIQGAIKWTILKTKLDVSVRIEKIFIHWDTVLLICYDEKSSEWAQEVVRAVPPPQWTIKGTKHPRGLKDIKSKTFGVWLPVNKIP